MAHILLERGLGQLSAWFLKKSSNAYLKVERNCSQRISTDTMLNKINKKRQPLVGYIYGKDINARLLKEISY